MPLPLKYLNRINQGESPTKYVTAGCFRPKLLHTYDSLTSSMREMYVDCGHCLNCRRDRRNQWVTRMCLHSTYWPHCYYVTLTYASYNLNLYTEHPFKKDWLASYPVLDSNNSFHAPRWTPRILCKDHLSKFFKRLREYTKSELSYCACGEYGEDYGRPHFHCVIWSKDVLTLDDFKHAWSYKCVKHLKYAVRRYTGKEDSYFYFRLGDVKMFDLVANGTLDWKAEFNGSENSASYCFQYVAKYIQKDDFYNPIVYARHKDIFINLPINTNTFDASSAGIIDAVKNEFLKNPSKKRHCLEESDSFIFHDFNYNNNNYEAITFPQFERIVGPFFVSSRWYTIGKEYALENLNRFIQGNYALPKFQGRQLAFPNYFSRLAALRENPLRLSKVSPRGKSYVKGSLASMYRYYELLRDDSSIFYTLPAYHRYKEVLRYDPIAKPTITDTPINGYMVDIVALDPNDGQINYVYFPKLDIFQGYHYNRHTRTYDFVEYVERIDFCDWVCDTMRRQFAKIEQVDRQRQLRLDLYDKVFSDDELVKTEVQRYESSYEIKQRDYKFRHTFRKDCQ